MAVEITTPPILQVVGYQNSGKTTVVEKIVKSLTSKDLRIGTIKHHGHGGEPESSDKGKDTERHRLAGAAVSSVEGEGVLQIQMKKKSWKLDEIITLYSQVQLDLIIIEGYKKERYPKLVILRNQEDMELLNKTQHVVAVISWLPNEHHRLIKQPVFSINAQEELLEWIEQFVRDYNG
ncbi:molybdopterin-guanine dinucleotide biosynthesis protein B [Litchfieldia alkalitelluris]|uniref:molybdopterin-guanine dinucleotide biosynthesis protein B n=1 Tax=Litchfieldia alkalitelluris TaxID=304268 RepID=UPI000997FA66|nr:molybdopterin-guanine dinucleotide biosynthesis protein B [Litchfieldia alkalitelluris]